MILKEGEQEPNYSIHKAAGIIIEDRKLLVTRTKGKEIFINPGGKLEPGESVLDALVREHLEELGIVIDPADCKPFAICYAEAAYNPGQWVKLESFTIPSWQNEIQPHAEVDEIARINSSAIGQMELASILEYDLIPLLVQKGMID